MNGRVYSAKERAAEAEISAGDKPDGHEEAANLCCAESATSAGGGERAEESIPDFPAECLGPVLEREARGISELCGVPLGMSAPMVLATASASLGKGLCVNTRVKGWITFGNLFVLVGKTSGSGGSLTFKHATKPFYGVQKMLRMEFEKIKPRLDARHALITSQIEARKGKARKAADAEERQLAEEELADLNQQLAAAEKERTDKTLCVDDVTQEKLAAMLAENDETMAQLNSDAADALGIIDGTRYGEGKHAHASLWLKGYTMESHREHRKNGSNVQLEAPCVAVLFVVTPDTAQQLFRNSRLTRGGLLPRFLACDPGARPVPVDENAQELEKLSPEIYEPYKAAIFAAVLRYRISAAGEPERIEITPAARRLLIADWNRFCAANNDTQDHPFEARHTENAIRIALVLHAFEHVDLSGMHRGHEHSLGEQTFRNAVRIRDWFTLHQENLRKPQRAAADEEAWMKAHAMLKGRPPHIGITARDLYNGRKVCDNTEQAQKLLEQWKTAGLIEEFQRKPAAAGRPTTAYRPPSLRGG